MHGVFRTSAILFVVFSTLSPSYALDLAMNNSGGERAMVGDPEARQLQELHRKVLPYLVVEVRSHVNGFVAQTFAESGTVVEKGDALFQIDRSRIEKELALAHARLERAKADLAMAETELNHYERRLKANAIIDLEYQQAEDVVGKAQAEVAVAQSEAAVLEFDLAQTKVCSPIDGRIEKSFVTQGELVTREQSSPLAVVSQIDTVYVEFEESVNWLMRFQDAMSMNELSSRKDIPVEVRLQFDDGKTSQHAGMALFSKTTVNYLRGTMKLRVEIPNADHRLLPGMTVTCQLRRKAG